MNPALSVYALTSIATVLVALTIGAYTDIKTRTCPRWIWQVFSPIAIASTLIWYIQSVLAGYQSAVIAAFITSAILCPICVFMGYRMGNGGDWRSLFFISLATPWVAISTLVLSCIFGGIHALIEIYTHRNITSAWKVTIPWMVAIAIAFAVSSFTYIFI